jgi:hypothetical protein
MPPAKLAADFPVVVSLREQSAVRLGLGDRTAIMPVYRRVC